MKSNTMVTALLVLGAFATVGSAAEPPGLLNYQGVLRDDADDAIDGTRDMVFRLHSDDACSTQVGGDIDRPGVQVNHGLFSVELAVTHAHFDGQGLWLEVAVSICLPI